MESNDAGAQASKRGITRGEDLPYLLIFLIIVQVFVSQSEQKMFADDVIVHGSFVCGSVSCYPLDVGFF